VRAAEEAQQALVARHGEKERLRIERGVAQVLRYWRPEDGAPATLAAFLQAEFLPQGDLLDRTFERFEFALERLGGYLTSLTRDLRQGMDLDVGPQLPLDERLAAFNVGAHVSDDMFANKLAFVALLNFPLTTLDERMAQGMADPAAVGRDAPRGPVPDPRSGRRQRAPDRGLCRGRQLHRPLQRLHAPRLDDRRRTAFPPRHAPAQPLESP